MGVQGSWQDHDSQDRRADGKGLDAAVGTVLRLGASLSEYERRIVERLLEVSFPGRDQLREQLQSWLVEPMQDPPENWIDIYFVVEGGPRADVVTILPVDVLGHDTDGVPIRYLLFVRDGLLHGLEISKLDGTRIRVFPDPQGLDVGAGASPQANHGGA
jgi:hypothetical protein